METIEELKAIIEDKEHEIAELEEENEEYDARAGRLEGEISDLEKRVWELESEDKGNSYNICGETVMIRCDNIAHETFFELLEEKSKRFSINELVSFLEKLS